MSALPDRPCARARSHIKAASKQANPSNAQPDISGIIRPMNRRPTDAARGWLSRWRPVLPLFAAELILWLGSRIRDTAFVEREGQKLIKLIEFTTSRPIPIVSFVARQRDLREFVGDEMPDDRLIQIELHIMRVGLVQSDG